ncbi:hypothetical protein HG717_16205 [Rhodococcus erythropolis]|uniref:hypothetical protein n=1 Tax=Rhodococcus erythropolis TaxID=1833 RepID=UPI001C9A6ED8|nr:hypothetical protein [Rhodococcus erythropolis]MBY6385443.1 hypothetical protein [Rhodococcus erythropolis]
MNAYRITDNAGTEFLVMARNTTAATATGAEILADFTANYGERKVATVSPI